MLTRVCLAVVVWCAASAPGAAQSASDAVCALLSQEIIGRLGPDVRVTSCAADAVSGTWTTVRPEANARVGVPSTFTLLAPGRSVRVTATVHAEGRHARLSQLIGRGRPLTADVWRTVDGPLTGARLSRVAVPEMLTGARATRLLEPDDVVSMGDVVLAPVVRAGDRVVAVVRIGAVEVTASMTAVDAGSVGDAIRIAHPDRKRVLQARVLAAGRVEVTHAR